MSQFSKRINISPDILIEYIYDDTNHKSEPYDILNNIKTKSKSFLSKTGLNTENNTFLLIDDITNKYSPINLTNFNFLRLEQFPPSIFLYDKIKIHFTNNFNFESDELGFYLNIFTYGHKTNTKYSLCDFFYVRDNVNQFDFFNLGKPFYYNSTYWVKSIEFEIPSVHEISKQRFKNVIKNINEPQKNSLNENLTNGEGLNMNNPIFINFAFISNKQKTPGVDYYYIGDFLSISVPQTPEFDGIGVDIVESTQGDYFEICGTYLGSNEKLKSYMDNESLRGKTLILNYIVKTYEENILTNTNTFEITENFTQKILYRPVITFSNTTAAIDVELKIIDKNNDVMGDVSKFGSIGITTSINKYGKYLTKLNLDNNVIKTNIYNLKYKNILGNNNKNNLLGINGTVISYDSEFNNSNSNSNSNSNFYNLDPNSGYYDNEFDDNGSDLVQNTFEIVKVPYPVMHDKYNILTNSNKSSSNDMNYYSNGLLEIVITSFDNIINFNIAKDINHDGTPTPFDLIDITNNSKIVLVFKSNSDKLVKELYTETDNYYEQGIIYFKINSSDYPILKKIYNSGYNNFYINIISQKTETQFFSGKFIFYEDVVFTSRDIDNKSNPKLDLFLQTLKEQRENELKYGINTGNFGLSSGNENSNRISINSEGKLLLDDVDTNINVKNVFGLTDDGELKLNGVKTGVKLPVNGGPGGPGDPGDPDDPGNPDGPGDPDGPGGPGGPGDPGDPDGPGNPGGPEIPPGGGPDPSDDEEYTNLIVYVRYQTNQDLFERWYKNKRLTPKYKHSSMYYFEKILKKELNEINNPPLVFIERTFIVPIIT